MTNTTPEVEEIVAEFEKLFCTTVGIPDGPTIVRWLNLGSSNQENAALTSKIVAWLRTTLTVKHEADIEKARQEERERIVNYIQEYGHAQYNELTHEIIGWTLYGDLSQLTPTKTDKRYSDVPCAHGVTVNEDCADCAETMKKLVFVPAAGGLPTKTDKQPPHGQVEPQQE